MGFNAAVLQRLQTTRPDTVESRCVHTASAWHPQCRQQSFGAAIEKGC